MRRERATRIQQQHNKPSAQRSKNRAKNRNKQFSTLQEATVPQRFLRFMHSMIGISSTSSHLMKATRMRVAWTLSRDFWQQKNFHAHRLHVSSPLAKPGFSHESIAADSWLRCSAHAMHQWLW